MLNTKFGSNQNGDAYTLELGANWISGLGVEGGPENPIWTFAKQANLSSTNSDTSSVLTYDSTGYKNFTGMIDEYEERWKVFEQIAGTIMTENLQDRSMRAGSWESGWRPQQDAHKVDVGLGSCPDSRRV
jgi:polyamine oxidase